VSSRADPVQKTSTARPAVPARASEEILLPTGGLGGCLFRDVPYRHREDRREFPWLTRITPFLWFDHQAEQAAKFLHSIFENSKIGKVVRNSEAAPGPTGAVFTVQFWLDGLELTALNGGPHFQFNEAVSFVVNCETQRRSTTTGTR
jgi:hypothetical protein